MMGIDERKGADSVDGWFDRGPRMKLKEGE